nr:DUF1186 domain-containing protein [uncultured Desulfobulbus sp.]
MELPEILTSLEIYDKKYPREAIDAALARRDEILPHLLALLEKVLESPHDYADPEREYWGHIYAVMLLGHWGEKIAHDVIADLFSLPDDLPNALFGEIVTDNLAMILFRTCGGDTERMKKLAVKKQADDDCRGAALQALSYAYSAGYLERDEILKFYGTLFTGEEAFPGSPFHNVLAGCVCAIYPEELMEQVEKAYEQGLIHPQYIRPHDFDAVVEKGKEKCLERLKEKIQRRQMDSVHEEMSWWACFEQPGEVVFSGRTAKTISAKSRKNKKSKSRQAKASKKANRKKKK